MSISRIAKTALGSALVLGGWGILHPSAMAEPLQKFGRGSVYTVPVPAMQELRVGAG
jgi:hypothetical protein